jgi:predicted TIM-barrel fold metal-dependent hydrolase
MPRIYSGPVIDPHHHLWDLALGRHPWLALKTGKAGSHDTLLPLRRNYLIDDYLADAVGQNIVATVHIEAAWAADDCVGETRWLDSLAKSNGVASRYVAHVALDDVHAAARLDAQASCPSVVGIRDILSWHPDPSLSFRTRGDVMNDAGWRRGLALLKAHDLVFDLMIFSGQLKDALRLARDFPDQLFVLNHTGSPLDRDAAAMAAWHADIKALAAAGNVAIKISALTGYDRQWTLESLRPLILHCIDAFGPDRTMFASDFPVTGPHASFAQTYDIYRSVTADFSVAEQQVLFFETARRIYKVPVPVQR